MLDSARCEKIKRAATLLRKKHGENIPTVSVEKILAGENIFIGKHTRTEAVYPIAVKKRERYGVLICSLLPEDELRWHEACALGSIVLGHLDGDRADSMYEDRMNDWERSLLLQEKELFAGELLMPESWMREFFGESFYIGRLLEAREICRVPMEKIVERICDIAGETNVLTIKEGGLLFAVEGDRFSSKF